MSLCVQGNIVINIVESQLILCGFCSVKSELLTVILEHGANICFAHCSIYVR